MGEAGARAPGPVCSDGGMSRQTRRSGRWTIEDQIASPWQYVDVEVPAGTRALRVDLSYDRQAGVLDLGCFGPAGFRGWSGGAREQFVIGVDGATPGYLPGELEPGRWRVALGLYQVPAEGLAWGLTTEASTPGGGPLSELWPGLIPDGAAEPPPAAESPARRRMAVVALFYIMGLLSKPQVITLPFVLLLFIILHIQYRKILSIKVFMISVQSICYLAISTPHFLLILHLQLNDPKLPSRPALFFFKSGLPTQT